MFRWVRSCRSKQGAESIINDNLVERGRKVTRILGGCRWTVIMLENLVMLGGLFMLFAVVGSLFMIVQANLANVD